MGSLVTQRCTPIRHLAQLSSASARRISAHASIAQLGFDFGCGLAVVAASTSAYLYQVQADFVCGLFRVVDVLLVLLSLLF
jgi:hypothetical protein